MPQGGVSCTPRKFPPACLPAACGILCKRTTQYSIDTTLHAKMLCKRTTLYSIDTTLRAKFMLCKRTPNTGTRALWHSHHTWSTRIVRGWGGEQEGKTLPGKLWNRISTNHDADFCKLKTVTSSKIRINWLSSPTVIYVFTAKQVQWFWFSIFQVVYLCSCCIESLVN